MVELAWIERNGTRFVVRRATYRAVGETLEMRTESGKVVLVVSQLEASVLNDAEILSRVAASLLGDDSSGERGGIN